MFALAALLLASNSVTLYSGPAPEPTATYKDWIVGCDNERNCTAIALKAAEGGDAMDHLQIKIEQPASHAANPTITINPSQRAYEEGSRTLFVDGEPTALPPLSEETRYVIEGRAARALLRKLANAKEASIQSKYGDDLAVASLAGLAASLLRIDDQQGRVDTPRALFRRGAKKPPLSLPGFSVSVPQAARSPRPPDQPSAPFVRDWYGKDQCITDVTIPDPTPALARLDGNSTLVIFPWRCQNGAYTLYSNIMILDWFGAWSPAEFDYDTGVTGDGPSNVLANARWIPGERVLESVSRLSAANDCGRVDRFIWDGGKFRLFEQFVMPECRGSFDRIRVWTVDVVER
jgi:hypothetical protein